jgi:ATP-dependent RNA helicase DHX37/DHR1
MSGAEKRLLRKRQAMLDAADEDETDSDEDEDDEDQDEDEDEDEDVEDDDSEDDEDVNVRAESRSANSGPSDLNSGSEAGIKSDEEGDLEIAEGSDTGSSDSEADPTTNDLAKQKRLKFRQWALQQTGVNLAPDLLALNKPYVEGPSSGPSMPKVGPLGEEYSVPSTSLLSRDGGAPESQTRQRVPGARPILKRRPSVDEARQQLPVVAEEQAIMESILLHPVVVICGETGSGKTTQIPQMLYEAGFGFPGSDNPGMIAVTQPRRVAAVSLAVRVASELNQGPKSNLVAHQIRYSSTTSKDTAIKFMTDGVLLRELSTDFLLSRYSVVVVDEAHERGVNTDVLVGVLSRVAKLREKLWREKKDDTKVSRSLSDPCIELMLMPAAFHLSHYELLSCRRRSEYQISPQIPPCSPNGLPSSKFLPGNIPLRSTSVARQQTIT